MKGQGLLLYEGSLRTVDAPAAGKLTEVLVRPGDEVARDQVVGWIQAAENQTLPITSASPAACWTCA